MVSICIATTDNIRLHTPAQTMPVCITFFYSSKDRASGPIMTSVCQYSLRLDHVPHPEPEAVLAISCHDR